MIGFAGKYDGLKLISISHVDASGIRSQWQADFLQVFPLRYGNLPATHFSDKECFEKHWRGDNYTTYEQFIKRKQESP